MKLWLFVFMLAPLFPSAELPATVPVAVLEAFSQMYPGAPPPFWEDREGAHVANFQAEGRLTKVFFEETGEWIETRTRISEDELPASVRAYLRENYPRADYSYIGEVSAKTGKLYRIESEMKRAIVIKLLNPAGELIREESIELDIPLPQYPVPALLPARSLGPVGES